MMLNVLSRGGRQLQAIADDVRQMLSDCRFAACELCSIIRLTSAELSGVQYRPCSATVWAMELQPSGIEAVNHLAQIACQEVIVYAYTAACPASSRGKSCLIAALEHDSRQPRMRYMHSSTYLTKLPCRFLLEGMYKFLNDNCRGWALAQDIPLLQLIEIGIIYEV